MTDTSYNLTFSIICCRPPSFECTCSLDFLIFFPSLWKCFISLLSVGTLQRCILLLHGTLIFRALTHYPGISFQLVVKVSPDWIFLLRCGTYAQLICVAHSNLKLKRSSTKRVLFPQPVSSQSLWQRHRLPKPGAWTASLSLSFSPQQLFLQQVLLFLILYLLEPFSSVHPIATTLVHAHHPLRLASCSNLLISLPCKVLVPTSPFSARQLE